MARFIHGLSQTPTYRSWRCMIERCYYFRNKTYHHYQQKGITVCDEWRQSFLQFLSDMGERPEGMTLDRRDNDGNYTPQNCRWISRRDQARNRSVNIKIEWAGKTWLMCDLALSYDINQKLLRTRLFQGMSLTRALEKVSHKPGYNRLKKYD